jgi:hypothetical protein
MADEVDDMEGNQQTNYIEHSKEVEQERRSPLRRTYSRRRQSANYNATHPWYTQYRVRNPRTDGKFLAKFRRRRDTISTIRRITYIPASRHVSARWEARDEIDESSPTPFKACDILPGSSMI